MAESSIDVAGRRFLTLDIPEAEVIFYPDFFAKVEADRLLDQLVETTAWRQDSMRMFGELKPLPRLTAWYCDPGARLHLLRHCERAPTLVSGPR